jgi:hypothetical protein
MVCHQDAEALHRIGAITDEEMAEYDRDCLVNLPKHKQKARKPTEMEHISPVSSGI